MDTTSHTWPGLRLLCQARLSPVASYGCFRSSGCPVCKPNDGANTILVHLGSTRPCCPGLGCEAWSALRLRSLCQETSLRAISSSSSRFARSLRRLFSRERHLDL